MNVKIHQGRGLGICIFFFFFFSQSLLYHLSLFATELVRNGMDVGEEKGDGEKERGRETGVWGE